jgi:phage/plasmid primase-like uncharacterized protein/phage/plasmid-associated DNA primase
MDELKALLAKHGFDIEPVFDGQFHRFVRGDEDPSDPHGWFKGREIPLEGGSLLFFSFGDWATQEKYKWRSRSPEKLTPEQKKSRAETIEKIEAADRQEEEERHRKLAELVARELPKGLKEGDCPYLQNKGLGGHGLFGCVRDKDRPEDLLVPLTDVSGMPWSVQRIFPDGTKRYLKGARKQGLFHLIPGPGTNGIYICEGLATGATVHLATGAAVACAMDAGNLLPVAQALRTKYAQAKLIIAADDDHEKPKNAGVTEGRKAAQAVGALFVKPSFERPEGNTDFNDLHVAEGLDAVKEQLAGGPAPAAPALPAPVTVEPGTGDPESDFEPLNLLDGKGNPRLPTEQELVLTLLKKFRGLLVKQERDIFRYTGTHWVLLDTAHQDLIKTGIQRLCGGRAKLSHVENAFKFFLIQLPAKPEKVDLFAPNPIAANFLNGTLWLRKNPDFTYRLDFQPHAREDYLVNVLPYEYPPRPEEKNEEFDQMLPRVFAGDPDRDEKIRAVRQMYGACLMPAFPKLFLLYGQPKTGKSTIINIATRLVHEENRCDVVPSEFEGFNMESMAGKLVNIDTDLPDREPIRDDVVKKIIDRKKFRIRRKGVKDLQAHIPAVHIFGANEIPPSFEASKAHERRWIFIGCNTIIAGRELMQEYWDFCFEQNPLGILRFALEGLEDLVAHKGHYSVPPSSQVAFEEWHRRGNPMVEFLHAAQRGEELANSTRLIAHPEARIKRDELWKIFLAWGEATNRKIHWITRQVFYTQMRREALGEVTIRGTDHFTGLGVLAAPDSQF